MIFVILVRVKMVMERLSFSKCLAMSVSRCWLICFEGKMKGLVYFFERFFVFVSE